MDIEGISFFSIIDHLDKDVFQFIKNIVELCLIQVLFVFFVIFFS